MSNYTFEKPYYNSSSVANTVTTEEAWNVYFESMPQGGYAIRKRPGSTILQGYSDHNPQGMFWSDRAGLLYFVINGNVYRKSAVTQFIVDPPTIIGTIGNTVNPVVFAEGQLLNLDLITYLAAGSPLKYIDDATQTVLSPTDPNTPSSTYIAMMNNRFYANDIYHGQDLLITDVNPATDLLDVLYWSSPVNPFRASARPDNIQGIYTAWNEIFLWGTQACEVWQEDGITPISPLVGSIIESGTLAPHSVVLADNTLIGLCQINGKRAVVALAGRNPNIISEDIANKLQEIQVVSDAIGSMCFVGGLNIYLLTFPTADITWAYDIKTKVWCQWSTWDTVNAVNAQYKGRYGVYAKDWNKHLVMSANGSIHELSRSQYTDSGLLISSSIRTGWIDHGTSDRKRCDQLIIKLKGYSDTIGKVVMRTRDDGFPN